MTKVETFYEDEIFKVTILGHAGYANVGEDIVCSAVSVLAFSLLEYLAQSEDRGLVTAFRAYTDEEKGYIDTSCIVADIKVLEGIRSLMGGFEILANNFEKFVSYSLIGRDSNEISY